MQTLFFSHITFAINFEFNFGEMRNCKIEILKNCYYYKVYNHLNECEDILILVFLAILQCQNLMRSLKKIELMMDETMKMNQSNKSKNKFQREIWVVILNHWKLED